MTDITTPAQMREADYCPFCGGMTETDFYQPYCSIGGKLGKACAIYCLDCSANMTICHEDHPGVDPEHLMSALVTEWNRRALPVAEPAPLAVRVKPLVWEETHDDRGDGSSEHNGCYEASTALGVYEIGMGFGSDAYYWSVCDPNYNEIGSFEDPSYAQAAAEADHAARILSQIEAESVAQVRAEALEEAAKLATSFLVGDPKNGVPLRNPLAHEIADAIRAMKGEVG